MATTGSRDMVGHWLHGAGRETRLTAEETFELARAVARGQAPDATPQQQRRGLRARDRIVLANLRLVASVARRYTKHCTVGIEFEDLLQEGTLGLHRAAEKYDSARGYAFATYAYWWIRQAITRALSNQSRTLRLPIHAFEKLGRLRRAGEAFAHEHGRRPSQEELSEAAGFTIDDVRFYSQAASPPVALDALRSDDAGSTSLLESIADPNAADPLEESEIDERVEWLEECLSEPGFATMSEIDALLDQLHGIPSEASAAGRPHNASTERRHRRTLTRRLKDRAQAEQLVAA